MITDANTDVPLSGSGLPLEATNQIAALTSRYIDLSAVSAGTGTIASPYTFAQVRAELEALTGDQLGFNYFFLRGSTATYDTEIIITAASNFNLLVYGTGARPVFNGNDLAISAMRLNDVQTCNVKSLHFMKGTAHGFVAAATASGNLQSVNIEDCEASLVPAGIVGNGFSLEGASILKATDITFVNNYPHDVGHNGVELSYMAGAVISDNLFENIGSMSVEYWNECTGCIQERNITNGAVRLVWLSDQVGQHSGNLVRNERAYDLTGDPIRINGADQTTVYNVTAYTAIGTGSGRMGINVSTSTNTTVKNCVLYLQPSQNVNVDLCINVDSASLATLFTDNNLYYAVDGVGATRAHKFRIDTTIYQTVGTWNAASSNNNDSDSIVFTDPLFIDIPTKNLRLQSGSPARYEVAVEAPGVVSEDIDMLPRINGIDLGAYQDRP